MKFREEFSVFGIPQQQEYIQVFTTATNKNDRSKKEEKTKKFHNNQNEGEEKFIQVIFLFFLFYIPLHFYIRNFFFMETNNIEIEMCLKALEKERISLNVRNERTNEQMK